MRTLGGLTRAGHPRASAKVYGIAATGSETCSSRQVLPTASGSPHTRFVVVTPERLTTRRAAALVSDAARRM